LITNLLHCTEIKWSLKINVLVIDKMFCNVIPWEICVSNGNKIDNDREIDCIQSISYWKRLYIIIEFYLVKNSFQIDHILFYLFKKYIKKPKSPFFSPKFA
jgi:hypothetical protein